MAPEVLRNVAWLDRHSWLGQSMLVEAWGGDYWNVGFILFIEF